MEREIDSRGKSENSDLQIEFSYQSLTTEKAERKRGLLLATLLEYMVLGFVFHLAFQFSIFFYLL